MHNVCTFLYQQIDYVRAALYDPKNDEVETDSLGTTASVTQFNSIHTYDVFSIIFYSLYNKYTYKYLEYSQLEIRNFLLGFMPRVTSLVFTYKLLKDMCFYVSIDISCDSHCMDCAS